MKKIDHARIVISKNLNDDKIFDKTLSNARILDKWTDSQKKDENFILQRVGWHLDGLGRINYNDFHRLVFDEVSPEELKIVERLLDRFYPVSYISQILEISERAVQKIKDEK